MTEQESFNQIDLAIKSFAANEGLHKGIKVSKKPHSDWLVFNWRQLTWSEKEINYLIEVYPTIDDNEDIAGWSLYAAAYYDLHKKRYYLKKNFAENKAIGEIANNAEVLISESYQFLRAITLQEIPLVSELS
jgi:hypothetical protein